MKQSPEALGYLQARGLVHGELVAKFRLGFANRTLGLRLPEKTCKAGADMRARLERIGIYRESGQEHFNGSLVVPILDEHGNVTELYGRKLRDDLRPGTPKHLYLPGPHRRVWNLDGIAGAGEEIILTESLIDAMAFWCAGFRNVTACYGTGGFTEDHLAAFRGAGILRVLIAFDRDPAGERGAVEVSERLRKEGFCSYRVEFPKGMDAAEYALKVTPAAKSLGVLIRKAVWLGQGQAAAITSAPRDVLLPEPPPPLKITEAAPINPRPKPIPPLAAKDEETSESEPVLPPLPAPPLPAARIPAPVQDIPAEVSETETVLSFGDRRWRVRGLTRNLAHDVLKVNLLASCGAAFHVDALDLYNARARASFLIQAAIELQVPEDVLKADLGRVLLKLEDLQDEAIKKALAPKLAEAVTMDEEARHAALALLKSDNLLTKILADFDACGIAGEATNKLVGYLAAVSRKLSAPLAVVI